MRKGKAFSVLGRLERSVEDETKSSCDARFKGTVTK